MTIEAVGYSLLAAFIFISFIYVIALIKDRYDIIDVAWGLVFIVITAVSFTGQATIEFLSVQTLVLLLVVTWGLRLSGHIYARWEGSEEEDRRYVALRQKYEKAPGGVRVNMYFRVYAVQAVLAVVVCAPILLLNTASPLAVTAITAVGLVMWLIGFIFEAVGDAQLRRYLKTTKSKVRLMTSGLWHYTRHPNYFGEVVQWWGIFIICLAVPYGWLAVVGPITITILLLFVSGVPLTEKHFEGRKGWSEYKHRTSKFLPLPPKKG